MCIEAGYATCVCTHTSNVNGIRSDQLLSVARLFFNLSFVCGTRTADSNTAGGAEFYAPKASSGKPHIRSCIVERDIDLGTETICHDSKGSDLSASIGKAVWERVVG